MRWFSDESIELPCPLGSPSFTLRLIAIFSATLSVSFVCYVVIIFFALKLHSHCNTA